MVNEVRQLQALVDKKRVIVTELSIRRDLHLDDAEGTGCLLTVTIFEELARTGCLHLDDAEGTGCLLTVTIFEELARMGRITPLFDIMMVQLSEEVGEDSDHPTNSTQVPNLDQPSTSSKPKRNNHPRRLRDRRKRFLKMRQSMRKVYPHCDNHDLS
ncbi:hypothetical protein Tco_1580877, partial [Tanacetum coccineum]